MRVLPGLIVALALGTAACPPTLPSSRPLGVFNLKDTTDGAGGYLVRPTGVFWQATNLPNLPLSTAAPDSCQDTLYFTPDTTTATISNPLDPGSPVRAQSSLGTIEMVPDTIPGRLILYKGPPAGLAHVPGADVIFTVPGAPGGFISMVAHAITAKKLILGSIDPQPTDSLHLNWVPGSVGTAAAVNMILYYSTTSTTVPSGQIICSMRDDGSFWMNSKAAAKWASGYGHYQNIKAFRWITTYTPGSDNALLLSVSEFDTTKTTFP